MMLHCRAARPTCRTWLARAAAGYRPSRTLCCPRALYEGIDAVVTPEWLSEHLDEVTILDVRGRVDSREVSPGVEQSDYIAEYDAYLEGHIPGAVFINWLQDGIDAEDPVPVQLQADPGAFGAALEAKGVSHEKAVVVYDSGDGMLAARYWWMLTAQGHPQPLVLERGWAGWRAAEYPTQLYEPCTLKVYSYFEAVPQLQYRVTAQELATSIQVESSSSNSSLLDASGSSSSSSSSSTTSSSTSASTSTTTTTSSSSRQPGLLVLDTRSPEQYSGAVRRGPRGGRVPGAVSLPRSALVDPATGWWLPLEQQRAVLEAAGVAFEDQQQPQQQRVVLYCNGGVAACTAALALQRLGLKDWGVYDGSWNEWSRTELPVEVD